MGENGGSSDRRSSGKCIHGGRLYIYYWRHRNEEVDFVLEKRGKLIGLEVKTSSSKETSGMKTFKDQFNPDRILLIGNKGALSWKEFIGINPAELF